MQTFTLLMRSSCRNFIRFYRSNQYSMQSATQKPFLHNASIIADSFINKIDPTVLDYPEVSEAEFNEVTILHDKVLETVNKYDNFQINVNKQPPPELISSLQTLGIFGLELPTDYGGLALSSMQCVRVLEAIGSLPSLSVSIIAHQFMAAKSILLAGNESQKLKYLPPLASGQLIAAFALHEKNCGSDAQSVLTSAKLSDDGKHYILNGQKTWITNAANANVFIVIARTGNSSTESSSSSPQQGQLSAFIVDKDSPGLVMDNKYNTLGLAAANIGGIRLENCQIPKENLLGEIGGGFKLSMRVLNSGRYLFGGLAVGLMKHLHKQIIDLCEERKRFDRPLIQFDFIQHRLSDLSSDLYGLESMTYFTAGLISSTADTPYGALEGAAVKIFGSDTLETAADICLSIVGSESLKENSIWTQYLRDIRCLQMFYTGNDVLRMFIGGTCAQHVGKNILNEQATVLHPLKDSFTVNSSRKISVSIKKLQLDQYIRPELHLFLSEFVVRHQNSAVFTKRLIAEKQKEIVETQTSLSSLADIGVQLYATLSVISRFSRSVSLQLPNLPQEGDQFRLFHQKMIEKLDDNIHFIESLAATDDYYRRIAEYVCKNGEYCVTHSLTRNW